ncbi:MAG: DUF5678 domain-containing protein [Candidatus Saccharimonadales bacterium]
MNDLDQEFKYYKAHQSELLVEYENRWIVIKDEAVVGAYNTQIEALTESTAKYEIGTFLIQFVDSGNQSYTQTFHSRVSL